MSEKLPSVSGKVLISFLESLGYEVVRQRGSHVRLLKIFGQDEQDEQDKQDILFLTS